MVTAPARAAGTSSHKDDMDEARIEAILKAAMEAIGANYLRGPVSPERAFEALNALAIGAAIIILGTGEDPAAKEFFLAALDRNIETNRR